MARARSLPRCGRQRPTWPSRSLEWSNGCGNGGCWRPSGDDGLRPALKVVPDPYADGLVHVEIVDLLRREEGHLRGLLAHPQRAGDDPAREADGELLADLTVVVGEHVPWVGVHPDDVLGLDLEARLLTDLADDRLADALADVHDAPGQSPAGVVAAPLQQDLALIVDDDRGGSRHQRVGPRRVRVVVVVDPAHLSWHLARDRGRLTHRRGLSPERFVLLREAGEDPVRA